MKIELFTEVNFRGPTAKNGKCIALVECETKKGPAVKAQIEIEQNTTYHRMSMIAILTGLRMLRPCEVTVYTPDQFLVTTINEGNMDKWKREEWRRPHGNEIRERIRQEDIQILLLTVLNGTMDSTGSLVNYDGGFDAKRGRECQKCFKILMRYGWSYEREEADLVYGNHELYKKES